MVMGHLFRALCAASLLPLAAACTAAAQQEPERLVAVVRQSTPFDPTSFTQGLEVAENGALYVGTGLEGQSRISLRALDGTETARHDLEPDLFGEGITRAGNSVWQLTWKDGVAIKRDADTLEETARTRIEGEGWGLCSRDDEVIYSDGTSQLRRMDPETLEERGRFTVTLNGSPVDGLNELECVGDEIYANVFLTTDILRIDATTGAVNAVIDASGLPDNAGPDPNNVLNGIAHIPGTEEFYLTGKRWPDLYRVAFVPAG